MENSLDSVFSPLADFVCLNVFEIKLKFSPQGMFALCDMTILPISLPPLLDEEKQNNYDQLRIMQEMPAILLRFPKGHRPF